MKVYAAEIINLTKFFSLIFSQKVFDQSCFVTDTKQEHNVYDY